MKTNALRLIGLAAVASITAASPGQTADSWPQRSHDLQLTGNASSDPYINQSNVEYLKAIDEEFIFTDGIVNATPVITGKMAGGVRLLIVGDWTGRAYVVDITNPGNFQRLVNFVASEGEAVEVGSDALSQLKNELGNYVGVQATATLATVTVPNPAGEPSEENRAYIGANDKEKSLWCLNLDKIVADRGTLDGDPADDYSAYVCDGPADAAGNKPWPRSLAFNSNNGTLNGSAIFSQDQPIGEPGHQTTRDVLYVPSTGLDCANGQFYAMDAYTGEVLWTFDPVVNGDGEGGTIWTTPSMNKDRTTVFLTTGDCVGKPQAGEKPESLVAVDAATGAVKWFHQRRLVDTADLDIGNGPLVADIPADAFNPECHVVVSPDKDGCMYGFNQELDIPQVGDLDFDPLRQGQQRVLYRKCFAPGSLNGGFNASNAALWGRLAVHQTSGYPMGHVGADDANAFAIDVCSGNAVWASSDIKNGRTDAAIANGMLFELGVTKKPQIGDYPYEFVREIQVVLMDPGTLASPKVLATVQLHGPNNMLVQPTLGGGGPAIVDGRIYVPTTGGVVVVGLDMSQGKSSPPQLFGSNLFLGPYPEPIAPGAFGGVGPVDLNNPYPLMLDNQIQRLTKYMN